ncbi:MAG: SusC/RagA family TonB-linked outer membrane protein [Rikenellaceae bacterium]
MVRKILLSLFVVLGLTLNVLAQNKQISGTVKDSVGDPILGASVTVVGTSIGVSTDVNGHFSFSAPKSGTLEVSFIGYKTQTSPIGDKSTFLFSLAEDSELLEDVVVVAYGTQTKASFVGSASVVGSDNIDKRVITNATSMFEGNTTGVQVATASGQPGESASVRIRGFGSINASSAPLYIVDGAIYDGEISAINPSDIESMTVLKDAASTAIYGASAGNGVIMITTKKGSEGANVKFTIRNGWSSRAYSDYETMGVDDYYTTTWTMIKNSLVTANGYTEEDAAAYASENLISSLGGYNIYSGIADGAVVGTDGTLNSNANILKWGDDLDWYDAASQTGYRQEYGASYGTRGSKSDTYASVNYLDEQGYLLKTDFERYSARLNYNINPVDWFKTGINLSMTRSTTNYSSQSSSAYANISRFIRYMAPIYPVHKHDLETGDYLDASGNVTTNPSEYVYDYDGTRLSDPGRDAIAETLLDQNYYVTDNQTMNTYFTIMPVEGLSFTVNYSLNNRDYRGTTYDNIYVGDGAGSGRMSKSSTKTFSQTFNQIAQYDKKVGDLSMSFLVGHESYDYDYTYLYIYKVDQTFEGMYELSNFSTVSSTSSYVSDWTKEGYFARANFDYANKYYLSLSYRHDGSSRFSAANRWGDFGSVGAGWTVSKEDFMSNVSWIDNLKLRTSYGMTGNDIGIGYYPYQTLYDAGYLNGDEAGVYFSSLANENLTWETQISQDVAVEFSLFGRLTGSVEYFSKTSKDLLFSVSQPTSTGVDEIDDNIGKLSNRGLEIELSYNLINTRDISLNIGANATFINSKIITLPDEMKENGYINGTKKYMEGYSQYEYWLRQWYGVNPDNGDGLYILDTDEYNEADGTLTDTVAGTIVEIDGETLTNSYLYAKYDYSGTSTPDVYGGFNFDFRYKNFDIAATFSYQLGGQTMDYAYDALMTVSSYGSALHVDLLDAWTTPGDVTDVPRIDSSSTHATSIGATSTRFLVSSDYLNLRSVSCGYTVPRDLLSDYGIKSVRFSFTAENLFMLKARVGLNPSESYSGTSYNTYMPARTFTIGADISF